LLAVLIIARVDYRGVFYGADEQLFTVTKNLCFHVTNPECIFVALPNNPERPSH